MHGEVIKIKIDGIPKNYLNLSFGRQIEYRFILQSFLDTAKIGHVGQKRISSAKAFRDFCKLHDVKQYYAKFVESPYARDDSYQIWYK